jgi:hypothetical protein
MQPIKLQDGVEAHYGKVLITNPAFPLQLGILWQDFNTIHLKQAEIKTFLQPIFFGCKYPILVRKQLG